MISSVFFFYSFLQVCNAYSYYSVPGTDTILHDGVDAFELLGTIPRPSPKHIKLLKLSPREIPDNMYPYPGREGPDISEYLIDRCNETENINLLFNAVNKTAADQYYHPAGLSQYAGDEEAIKKADRIKARLTLNNVYSQYHITPLYIPPGELLTIEYVSEAAKNSVILRLNSNSPSFVYNMSVERIFKLQIDIKLTEKVNKIVWPYGGQIAFAWNGRGVYPEGDSPIELTISGPILSPMFIYGVDTDYDFEKQLKERAGPIGSFDAGNVMGQGLIKYVKPIEKIRAQDCMRLLRSRGAISQKTAKDIESYKNDQEGRMRHPNVWFFDQYMSPGAVAYAATGHNYCQFNHAVFGSQFTYSTILRGGWGANHEQNHHHQQNWGVGYTGEVTNNVINLVCYAITADTLARVDNGNGNVQHGTFSGEDHTHNYFDLWGENDDNLAFWNNWLHCFGVKKFQEFVRSDQRNLDFDKKEYGNFGAELLRSSKMFGYNMIHHFNFHNHSNITITANNTYTNIFPTLSAMKLPFFHPVTNFYTSGHLIKGEEIITVNPFPVPGDFNYIFDFDKYLKTREECNLGAERQGGKELWGHFEYQRLEPKGQGKWREISKGKYDYTPPDDVTAIDKFYLVYKDTTTNAEYTLIGLLRQKLGAAEVIRYDNVLDESGNKYNDALKAYEAAIKNDITSQSFTSSFNTGRVDSGFVYVSIAAGSFKVPEDSSYTFYLKDDDKGLFYLSDKELKLDPNQDKDSLLITSNREVTNYNDNYKSTEQNLVKDKLYYFAIVCYNTGGAGYAQVGIKYGTNTVISDIPGTWIASRKDSSPETIKKMEFIPEWHEIPCLNTWKGTKSIDIDPDGIKIVSLPPEQNNHDPSVIFNKLTDINNVYITRWTTSPIRFPHIYDFDFQKEESFGFLNYHSYNVAPYTMNASIEIYLAPSAESIENPEYIIYSGNYLSSNPAIELKNKVKGRFFRIKVLSNNNIWGYDRSSSSVGYISFGTWLSENYKYVIPTTNTKIYIKGEAIESRKSIGYNGKTKTFKKSSEMFCRFPKGLKELVVVGDKYDGMGSASFYIDDVKVGDVDKTYSFADITNLKFASRSYRSFLFQSEKLDENKNHILKMVVTEGELTIAGFVSNVEYLEDYLSPPTSGTNPQPIDPTSKDGDSTGDDSNAGGKNSNTTPIIIGVVVGVVVIVAAIIGVVVYLKKCKTEQKSAGTIGPDQETNFGNDTQATDPYNLNL